MEVQEILCDYCHRKIGFWLPIKSDSQPTIACLYCEQKIRTETE